MLELPFLNLFPEPQWLFQPFFVFWFRLVENSTSDGPLMFYPKCLCASNQCMINYLAMDHLVDMDPFCGGNGHNTWAGQSTHVRENSWKGKYSDSPLGVFNWMVKSGNDLCNGYSFMCFQCPLLIQISPMLFYWWLCVGRAALCQCSKWPQPVSFTQAWWGPAFSPDLRAFWLTILHYRFSFRRCFLSPAPPWLFFVWEGSLFILGGISDACPKP